MSVGVMAGSSSSSPTAIKADLHRFPFPSRRGAGGGGGGGNASFEAVRTVAVPPARRWGSLRSAPPPSSASFVSSFRARAAVKDGVTEGEAVAGRKSFYDLLGIPQEGTVAEIKKAYKEMARRYHPDVCPYPDRTDEYTRRFIEVQEAYETLLDPGRRARYDRDLARGFHHAFSARRRPYGYYYDEEIEEKSQWRNRWQDQVAELKRRSMHRATGNATSWAARMRGRREEASSSTV